MYQEEKFWFNQQLIFHVDSTYGSNGTLDIGITSNTGDYRSFTPPSINFQISNDSYRKNVIINYQNVRDLIQSIGNIVQDLKNAFENKHQILKKYNKSKNLIFDFIQTNTNSKVINISIKSGDNDFTNIYVDVQLLSVIFNLLKRFEESYLTISFNFQNRSILMDVKNEIENVKKYINSLSSFASESLTPRIKEERNEIIEPEIIEKVEVLNSDFDEFLGEGMKNIELVDLPKDQKKEMIQSPFLNNTLNNNISNFESLITSISQGNSPVLDITKKLNETIDFNVEYLPSISEDDLKAILHFGKVFFNVQLKNYINGNSVSSTPPVIWYSPEMKSPENIQLAYDFLMISGYVRIMKNKLENKTSDSQENKSLLYIATRCFTDPFIFSFINDVSSDILKSCVVSRFESCKENGFFKPYEKILNNYGCTDISKNELSKFIDDISEKVIGKHPKISELYEKANMRLPFKNKLDREHIISETIPLETEVKFGLDINNDDSLAVLPFSISSDVLKTFRGEIVVPTKNRKIRKDQEMTNILRFSTQYRNEIPEKYKDEFLEHLNSLKENDYDFPSSFSLDELGENILKAIYIWNMTENKNEKYTDFFVKVEECILTRKMISDKFNPENKTEDSESSDTTENSDWVSLLNL